MGVNLDCIDRQGIKWRPHDMIGCSLLDNNCFCEKSGIISLRNDDIY